MIFEFTSYLYQDGCEIPVEVAAEYTTSTRGVFYQRNGDPGDPPEGDEVSIIGIQAHGYIEVKFYLLSDEEQNRIVNESRDEAMRVMEQWNDEAA